jgi:hypothetical protein
MARQSKREYLRSIHKRYRQARRKEKSAMLEEFSRVCGYNRKYAIWLLIWRGYKDDRKPGSYTERFLPFPRLEHRISNGLFAQALMASEKTHSNHRRN